MCIVESLYWEGKEQKLWWRLCQPQSIAAELMTVTERWLQSKIGAPMQPLQRDDAVSGSSRSKPCDVTNFVAIA